MEQQLDFTIGDYVKIKGLRGKRSSGKVTGIAEPTQYVTVLVDGSFRTFTAAALEPLTTLVFSKPGNKRRTRKRVTALNKRDVK